MINSGNLSKQELLHLFIDGELDSHEEEGLFNAVAADPDIRAELRDMMSMRQAFHGDAVRILPGDALKMSLLATLDSEFGSVVPSPITRSLSILVSALKYVALPVLTGLAGFYLGSSFLEGSSLERDRIAAEVSASLLSTGAATIQSLEEPATGTVLVQRHGADRPAYRQARPVERPDGRSNRDRIAKLTTSNGNLRVASDDAFRRGAATATETSQRLAVVELVPPLGGGFVTAPSSAHQCVHVDSLSPGESTSLYPDPESPEPLGVAFHVRNFNAIAFPSTTVPTNAAPLFDNASAGVYYTLSEHGHVGIEVGQESFAQVFETALDGQRVRIEQNPHTWWGAAGYRFVGDNAGILLDGAPLLEGSIGASRLGGIARASVGIDLAPDERWSFIVSLGGTVLAYQANQTWHLSTKVGVLYGAQARF